MWCLPANLPVVSTWDTAYLCLHACLCLPLTATVPAPPRLEMVMKESKAGAAQANRGAAGARDGGRSSGEDEPTTVNPYGVFFVDYRCGPGFMSLS